jgi:hypothetical protein
MNKITDMNVTNLDPSKHDALLGDAHELLVAGILTRLGFEVGLLAAKGAPYDIWIIAYSDPKKTQRVPLRVQIKTAGTGSVRFVAGTRGGIDRKYISGVKEYKYSVRDNDLIIGVDKDTLDLYLIPTRFISKWGKTKSLKKLQILKNKWELLLNWNDKYLNDLEKELND